MMLKKLKSFVSRIITDKGYHTEVEDLTNLLTTLGVLAALVLSLVSSLQFAIPFEDLDATDFRILLGESAEFRAFAKSIWVQEGHGFEVQIGVDQYFDISEVLNSPSSSQSETWRFNVDVAYQYMKPEFPFSLMRAWLAHRQMETTLPSLDSDWISQFGAVAVYLCAASFATSVSLYLSLLLSYVGEDVKFVDKEQLDVQESLKAWKWLGMPCTLLAYLTLVVSLVFFGMSTHGVSLSRSIHAHHRGFHGRLGYAVIVSMIVFTLFIPWLTYALSCRASYIQHKEANLLHLKSGSIRVHPEPEAPLTSQSAEQIS
mmetsp:Transcript_51094/g.119625  ORF Transcript_51094/g.119625 Transcript_51094/m.119625 type:complete len:315 (-) Transcript_51094:446-1390(-)